MSTIGTIKTVATVIPVVAMTAGAVLGVGICIGLASWGLL